MCYFFNTLNITPDLPKAKLFFVFSSFCFSYLISLLKDNKFFGVSQAKDIYFFDEVVWLVREWVASSTPIFPTRSFYTYHILSPHPFLLPYVPHPFSLVCHTLPISPTQYLYSFHPYTLLSIPPTHKCFVLHTRYSVYFIIVFFYI